MKTQNLAAMTAIALVLSSGAMAEQHDENIVNIVVGTVVPVPIDQAATACGTTADEMRTHMAGMGAGGAGGEAGGGTGGDAADAGATGGAQVPQVRTQQRVATLAAPLGVMPVVQRVATQPQRTMLEALTLPLGVTPAVTRPQAVTLKARMQPQGPTLAAMLPPIPQPLMRVEPRAPGLMATLAP